MRKVIGIIPLYDEEKESYWMVPGYMKMLEENGAIPMMLPLTDNQEELDYFLKICEGFLLTGGHDINPELYGEKITSKCGPQCLMRDRMEKYILERAVEKNKAVLGICRGIQFMNVCYGGTLYQDLPTDFNSKINHHMNPPYDRTAHYVNVKKSTPLYDMLQCERIGVNSYHHQAVKKLSDKFKVMATADDGLIEAIYMPDRKFIAAVQWHPEFSYKTDENMNKIVEGFLINIINE